MLTGDWYHFQDELTALPADLQGVIEMIPGGSNTTSYAVDKTESDGSVPGGCTIGGFDLGKNSGGIRLNLAEGLLQLKVNLHFTGDRTYKINWTLADNTTGSFTTSKMSKTTLLSWDVLQQAGITEAVAKNIRSIELLNTASGGGARLYDIYIRVPSTETAINNVSENANINVNAKVIENGRIVVIKNGVRYDLLGRKL